MRYIATEKIPLLLAELKSGGGTVWAPQVIRDTVNTVLFTEWTELDEISFDAYTTLSAKQLVLPATEKLYSFRYERAGTREELRIEEGEASCDSVVLFGARACDARSLTALDALFAPASGAGYQDPYYRQRREALTVITLACTICDSACFCSSFGEGPADKSGSDVFLYPAEGGFLAEPLTEAGGRVTASSQFEDSAQQPPALAETARIEVTGLPAGLKEIFADLGFWERAAERCLSCGYCSYACPACHCFNIFDEMRSDRAGERLRAWDSCMFHLYTQETSGHNPRPAPAHRFRNRISHKFSYYPENQGTALCTGCGRCIRGCPAGVDMREILRQAAAPSAGGPGAAGGGEGSS